MRRPGSSVVEDASDATSTHEEQRFAPRTPLVQHAAIVLNDKPQSFPCSVRNLSEGGACIGIVVASQIPNQFGLALNGIRFSCRVSWRTENKLGVTFR
jgi:hypothetical protein